MGFCFVFEIRFYYSPVQPGTHYVDRDASLVLGLKECTTKHSQMFLFGYANTCSSVCGYGYKCGCSWRAEEGVPGSLGLELQVVVSHLAQVLGTQVL